MHQLDSDRQGVTCTRNYTYLSLAMFLGNLYTNIIEMQLHWPIEHGYASQSQER